ncbi:hypothetical protein PCANC_01247 [Puccinia coronata f. sp. avenae]|uniref:Uncharacterized protein n=1 Tax=Puccinia coronata f. sp. avenae TaxID=200324 RepID=A0A2N5T734_9BASI|nr:hypothetical protein PCASD_17208 [Puccinia coronata f. sp. avenae]PLW21311.1 hypothetical protein PCANC_05054 [Puccinia coronata f. sp. avenae]PLW44268.1 hypothetical protein PCASD_03832 [Puccinia coronata f. sp. avenae]PLW56931.1 hypothetical protein PCANC_01247 [Puccinia coronata f. sp. avenae]
MNWRAYLLVISLAIIAASASYDEQLLELANQIASAPRPNNRRIGFDHHVGAKIINPRGDNVRAISSDFNRDHEPQQEIQTARGSKRDHINSHEVIPLPRCQSQAAGNVLSMGKKAKLQNHEYVVWLCDE